MPNSAGFDPCREWLGIDAIDLGDPYRTLGLSVDVADPAIVSAAAERLLERLRGTHPGPFTLAHDALTRRIEACRDELLTMLSAREPNCWAPPPRTLSAAPLSVPPPVPPPVPPTVPGPATDDQAGAAATAVRADEVGGLHIRRPRYGRPDAADPLPAFLSLLAVLVAALAAYVAWPHVTGTRHAQPPVVRVPRAASPPSTSVVKPPESHRAAGPPVATLSGTRRTAPQPRPSDEPPRSRPADRPAQTVDRPQSPQDPLPPPAQPDPRAAARTAAAVEKSLREAYAAILDGAFAEADRKLQEADRLADDDALVDRVTCWRQFTRYAREFGTYRERALNDANAGGDYEVRWEDGRVTRIAVIESTPQKFAFKSAGRIERMPRTRIPEPIVTAIVKAWFAAADQPGNHVFLGTHLLARRKPDPDAAGREWTLAKQGGEDVSNLRPLLQDPIIVKAATGR